jgi:hypothetical protein
MLIGRSDFNFRVRFLSALSHVTVLLACFALSACLSVRLIGDYDNVIDQGVTDVQQKFEMYFAKLNSNPDTPFDQNFYDDISARLAVLKTRSTSMPNNEIITQQLGELQATFDDLQKMDKLVSRPIKTDAVMKTTPFTNARTAIEVSVESILKLEIALKRGGSMGTNNSSAPPTK